MAETSFPFVFQTFGVAADRVLLAGAVVGLRNGDGLFKPPALLDFFDVLRVPRPANVHKELSTLERRALLRRVDGFWSVTPVGRARVQDQLQLFDVAELNAYLAGTPGSLLGNERHAIISCELAPAKWVPAIERLIQEFSFETNVFLMTRFPASEKERKDKKYLDPIAPAIPIIKDALRAHGLTLHLASDRQLDDDLLGNVAAHMWACQFGIGILENRLGRGLNYNVMTEIGAMLMTGRRCALLKDTTAGNLPTDIIGHIHKPVDLADLQEIHDTIHLWASRDLALGPCQACPE